MGLTAQEMTCLVGGMRVLGTNHSTAKEKGVLTDKVGALTNDFFVNLVDMKYTWKPTGKTHTMLLTVKLTKLNIQPLELILVLGSNSILRSYAEVYAQDDNKKNLLKILLKFGRKL